MRYLRLVLFSFWFCLSFTPSSGTSAYAQLINLTSPAQPISTFEGDEFSSIELRNPWDANERRDFGWEENLEGAGNPPVRSENGILVAQFSGRNGHVYPLFQGFTNSLFAEGLDGDRSLPRFGRNHPIEASKYSYLSYRMNVSSRSVGSISWSNESSIAGGGWPNQRAAYFDGYYSNVKGVQRSGYFTYLFDLSSLNSTFGPGLYDGSWNGRIISLRIEPSSSADRGTQLGFDWIRLSDPRSAPWLNLQWSKTIIAPNTVLTLAYSNSPAESSELTPVQQFAKTDPGQFQFPLSALPPGDYYFRVVVVSEQDRSKVLLRSNPSPVVRILPAPELSFNSPTEVSGEDYASSTLGDSWDMNNPEDLPNLDSSKWSSIWRQFSDSSFLGGRFNALADGPLPGAIQSDVQVHLNVSPSRPIDTTKYRYLTYRIQADDTNHPSISEKAADGWVMRAVGWNDNHSTQPGAFLPSGHLLYEGDHTYTYDLWDESAEALDLGSPWKLNQWLYHFRLDPLEVTKPTRFSLDDVRLTAEPRPDANGNFLISFNIQGSGSTLRVWASPSSQRSINTQTDLLIHSASGVSSGSYQFYWNMNGLQADSRWYIKSEVSTGSQSTRLFVSPVPIAAGAYVEKTPPAFSGEPISNSGPGNTLTSPPRAPGPKLSLVGSNLSRRSVREGQYVSFKTKVKIASGDKVKRIRARISAARRSYTVNLRSLGKGQYYGRWRAKRADRKSHSVFKVELNAETSRGHKERNSLGSVKVRR